MTVAAFPEGGGEGDEKVIVSTPCFYVVEITEEGMIMCLRGWLLEMRVVNTKSEQEIRGVKAFRESDDDENSTSQDRILFSGDEREFMKERGGTECCRARSMSIFSSFYTLS